MKKCIRNFYQICALAGIFLLSSCKNPHWRAQDSLMGRLAKRYTKAIEKEFGLQGAYVGSAAMTDIKELIYGFQCRKHVGQDEATLLIIKCSEILLDMINTDEGIRPYLHNYPFTSKNVAVSIIFSDENVDEFAPEDYIASVRVSRGKVTLSSYDREKQRLVAISRLPYQQVVEQYSETLEKAPNLAFK